MAQTVEASVREATPRTRSRTGPATESPFMRPTLNRPLIRSE